jgi:hypothetical protein
MIDVSNKFVSIMKNNIRPKTDFKITVTGNGNTLEWTAKDITNFTFKRGIDPVGRNLPFLELTWEEIYLGELNTDNEATKYNNITPYMTVELTIEQSLSFVKTWKDISQLTWAEIFNSGMTWRDVLKKPVSESVKMPTMFLVGKPEVQNQKIKWTARDFLYFLDNRQQIGFKSGINYRNPMRWFLLDERANFKNNIDMFNAIDTTQRSIISEAESNIDRSVVFEGTTKNLLKDFASAKNYFWDFEGSYAKLKGWSTVISQESTVFSFTPNIIKAFPKLTKNSNVSSYSFVQNTVTRNINEKYTISEPSEDYSEFGATINKFVFEDWGEADDASAPKIISKETYSSSDRIAVIPVSITRTENFVNCNNTGEVFQENNSCNFYGKNAGRIQNRMSLINRYFNDGIYTAECEGLPVFHIGPCDMVEFPTNLVEGVTPIKKKGIIVEQTLSFNGAFNQKNIIHEVSV